MRFVDERELLLEGVEGGLAVYRAAVAEDGVYFVHFRRGFLYSAIGFVADDDGFAPKSVSVDPRTHFLRKSQEMRLRLVSRPPGQVSRGSGDQSCSLTVETAATALPSVRRTNLCRDAVTSLLRKP